MVVSVEASTGSATAFVPSSAACDAWKPHALVAMDRLEHDDGVVDEPPHRERETAEGEGVQGLALRVQDDERDGEGERDRDRHDRRCRACSAGRSG